jgi:hypothetical protein
MHGCSKLERVPETVHLVERAIIAHGRGLGVGALPIEHGAAPFCPCDIEKHAM